MKLIIAGSRYVNVTSEQISCALRGWLHLEPYEITEVVSGGARGVDKSGEQWAEDNSRPYRVFPADWDTHGRAAGPIRNQEMADYADIALVFWDGRSRGTLSMISEMAQRRKLSAVIGVAP